MILVRIDHPYLRVEHHRGEVIEEPVLGGCAERGGGDERGVIRVRWRRVGDSGKRGRMKTVMMHMISKAPSVRQISASSTSGRRPGDAEG
jgi:hypothetical protein